MNSNKDVKGIKRFLPLILSLIVILIDQITKIIVVRMNDANNQFLQSHNPDNWINLIGDWLRIRLGYNANAIFGLDFGLPPEYKQFILIGTTTVAVIIILILFTRIRADKLFPRICFGLVIGGALGNLIDRVFGYILYKGEFKLFFEKGVVDWIDMGFPENIAGGFRWYTFNMADAFITVSIVILLIYILFSKEHDIFVGSRDTEVAENSNSNSNEEITEDSEKNE
jgi:signal peptidase II